MINNTYVSKSIPYQLTNWFDEVRVNHRDHKQHLDDVFSICDKEIIPLLASLQKTLGKQKSNATVKQKEELAAIITDLDTEILILIEFLQDYITHLQRIEEYELKIKTSEKMVVLLSSDTIILKKISEYLRNVLKAGNVVFITNKRTSKKRDDVFDNYAKEYIRFIRNTTKEFVEILNQYNKLVNDLAIEIENIKLDIAEKMEEAKVE